MERHGYTPHPYPVSKVPSFNGLERGIALRSSWGRTSPQNLSAKGLEGFWEACEDFRCLPLSTCVPNAEGLRSLPYRYGATAGANNRQNGPRSFAFVLKRLEENLREEA